MHSLARNRALVEGNKRLAWTACRTFLVINDHFIRASEDDRFNFVIDVATGAVDDVSRVADQLHAGSYEEDDGVRLHD